MQEKHLLGPLKGFFMVMKKVKISMKNTEKGPNKCFSQVKKIYPHKQNSRDVGSFMPSRPTYPVLFQMLLCYSADQITYNRIHCRIYCCNSIHLQISNVLYISNVYLYMQW